MWQCGSRTEFATLIMEVLRIVLSTVLRWGEPLQIVVHQTRRLILGRPGRGMLLFRERKRCGCQPFFFIPFSIAAEILEHATQIGRANCTSEILRPAPGPP